MSTRLFAVTLLVLIAIVAPATTSAQITSPHIRTDQFGYRPSARKIAVLREMITGYDAPAAYTPGTAISLLRAGDDTVAFTASPTSWNGGAVHAQSGDRVWWFDFSNVTEEGDFYILDQANGARSESFRIAPDVYADVLEQATRMFFYQRCGSPKATPHAHPDWSDTACHLGALQDTDCRAIDDPSPASSRDLSGGWHDAGDYNKYVNFTDDALHNMLGGFRARPAFWPDDWNLPESGNGIPDLLDETRCGLEWMLKMQNADGSVLHKVSVTSFAAASPPSADVTPRRYARATASATISACGAFAHGALAFRLRSDAASQTFATVLETAAISAWNWLVANPSAIPSFYDNAGFVNATAEDDPDWQAMNRLRAAIYLFDATGNPAYRTWIDANYTVAHLIQWSFALVYEQSMLDAFLHYGRIAGATSAVANQLRTTYTTSIQSAFHLGNYINETDAYGAHLADQDHVWGSNRVKSQQGLMFVAMNHHGLDIAGARDYLDAAEGYVHYLHGLNPPGYCYLTHMDAFGSEGSVREMYHAWFADGTDFDNADTSLYGPASGFLTGGVNPFFSLPPTYFGPPVAPPQFQPEQKAYRDFNDDWPLSSWQVSEPQLSYQAAYVRLLSEFALGNPARLGLDATNVVAGQTATFTTGGADPGVVAFMWSFALGRFTFQAPFWCADLGLAITPADPLAHVIGFGGVDPSGTASINLSIPPFASGFAFHMQTTASATCPEPAQSAVMRINVP